MQRAPLASEPMACFPSVSVSAASDFKCAPTHFIVRGNVSVVHSELFSGFMNPAENRSQNYTNQYTASE